MGLVSFLTSALADFSEVLATVVVFGEPVVDLKLAWTDVVFFTETWEDATNLVVLGLVVVAGTFDVDVLVVVVFAPALMAALQQNSSKKTNDNWPRFMISYFS